MIPGDLQVRLFAALVLLTSATGIILVWRGKHRFPGMLVWLFVAATPIIGPLIYIGLQSAGRREKRVNGKKRSELNS